VLAGDQTTGRRGDRIPARPPRKGNVQLALLYLSTAQVAKKTNSLYIKPRFHFQSAGDQTEQEEEETQLLRDPRKERRSTGDAAAAQYQRKSAKKTRPVEETSEEDEESARKRREKGKAKEVEGGWND
jgi:hypothetical protein